MTLTRARSVVLWALTVEVVVLAVTGVALYFVYRPDAAAAFSDISASVSREITFGSVVRDIHGWAAWLAVATALVAAVLFCVRATPSERVASGIGSGVGLFVAVLAASFTGYLLPWDQLALFAVTVGENMRGYTWLRSGDVRFVLMDGTEIAPSTVFKWLVLHAVVLGGAVVALLGLAWRHARQAPGPPPAAVAVPLDVPAGV